MKLPELGRGWSYYRPTKVELDACVRQTVAKAPRRVRECTQQERILGLCS